MMLNIQEYRSLRHHTIEFSLMEAGHTKFHPDWHFGLWKVRWRGSTVETMTEMAESVSQSSRGGHNIPQLVDDQESPVHFYDWSSYLKRFFKPIPQLTTYHHFRYEYTSNLHIATPKEYLIANIKDADWSAHPESEHCLC